MLFVILGVRYNLLVIVLAVPFGLAAYLTWSAVTGRFRLGRDPRARRSPASGTGRSGSARRRRSRDRQRAGPDAPPTTGGIESRAEARRVLGVGPQADPETVRRAYRDRVKEVHPDADGGSERAFVRVRAAYETLRDD